VRLMLKFRRPKKRAKLCPKKLNSVALICIFTQTHPDEVEVIRHETINRAEQTFAVRGVQHHFPKGGMKRLAQPTL